MRVLDACRLSAPSAKQFKREPTDVHVFIHLFGTREQALVANLAHSLSRLCSISLRRLYISFASLFHRSIRTRHSTIFGSTVFVMPCSGVEACSREAKAQMWTFASTYTSPPSSPGKNSWHISPSQSRGAVSRHISPPPLVPPYTRNPAHPDRTAPKKSTPP